MNHEMKRQMLLVACLLVTLAPAAALAHGNVSPQPVDTKGLEPVGETWRTSNPYRGNAIAIKIGKSAYDQQCARCHGIEGISGGLAPDLRSLEKADGGDKDFMPPVRRGVVRDGRTMMPKYEGILSQEAMWAIRSWLETVHE
ncbi:MAG: cytochrome c-550 PedF [Anaeromyxobacteraceae bacterium]